MVNTPYQDVVIKFIKKIKQDVKFFMYNGLSADEIEAIVNQRSLELLDSACDEIESQLDQLTLSNRDDVLECFDDELTRMEIDTISDMMKIIYMREPILKLNKLQTYIGTDIKTWSPPDERRTYSARDFREKDFVRIFGDQYPCTGIEYQKINYDLRFTIYE